MNGEKESIIIKLKENGCRITKQRKMILDIILEDRCSSCKEIYARVVKLDQSIGTVSYTHLLCLACNNSFLISVCVFLSVILASFLL